MEQSHEIGDRITDKSAPPDEGSVRDWIGPQAFVHWVKLRNWIDASYPGVFTPEWLYGGKKRGWSLRYKKTKAFCTILPEYRRLSIVVVLGGAEREKFAEAEDKAPLVTSTCPFTQRNHYEQLRHRLHPEPKLHEVLRSYRHLKRRPNP